MEKVMGGYQPPRPAVLQRALLADANVLGHVAGRASDVYRAGGQPERIYLDVLDQPRRLAEQVAPWGPGTYNDGSFWTATSTFLQQRNIFSTPEYSQGKPRVPMSWGMYSWPPFEVWAIETELLLLNFRWTMAL